MVQPVQLDPLLLQLCPRRLDLLLGEAHLHLCGGDLNVERARVVDRVEGLPVGTLCAFKLGLRLLQRSLGSVYLRLIGSGEQLRQIGPRDGDGGLRPRPVGLKQRVVQHDNHLSGLDRIGLVHQHLGHAPADL